MAVKDSRYVQEGKENRLKSNSNINISRQGKTKKKIRAAKRNETKQINEKIKIN